MAAKNCSNKTTGIALVISAAILFVLSIIVFAIFPDIYQSELKRQLPLLKNNPLYPIWRDLPIPIYQTLHFFNVTNGDAFMKGAKLEVVEVGPFTYRAVLQKENIRWYPNGTMSYEERKTYQFLLDKSVGSEDTEIFTLNAPMAMAGNMFKDSNELVKFGLGVYLAAEGEHLVMKRTVKELVYDGYEDPIIKEGKWVISDLPYKNGMFSWLYGKNDSYDGTYTVFSGQGDITKVNVIDKYNGLDKLSFWKNDTCNMINGSSGEIGPPLLEGQKEYSFFQSLICRTLTFDYTGTEEHMGVTSNRFSASEKNFGNETVNPHNVCFDTKPYLRTGVQDISRCQYGAPVVLSFPHFYLADPYYLTQVDGLLPSAISHSSHIDVEPITGASVELQIRVQLNLEVNRISGIGQFEKVRGGVYPVFWLEFDAHLNKELADFLKHKAYFPKQLTYGVTATALIISVILFVVGLVIIYRAKAVELQGEDDPILDYGTHTRTFSSSYSAHAGSENVKSQSSPGFEISKEQPMLNDKYKGDDDDLLSESEQKSKTRY